MLAKTLSLRTARPATVLLQRCDIPSLVERRPKCPRQSLAHRGAMVLSSRSPRKSRYPLIIGFGKRGLLEKGSFQKSPFSRDSRDSRDSSSEKTPFVMTPFSGPEIRPLLK